MAREHIAPDTAAPSIFARRLDKVFLPLLMGEDGSPKGLANAKPLGEPRWG
jgi:hypothetical protein